MTRHEAVERMVKLHRAGIRPLRWSIMSKQSVEGWTLVSHWDTWLDVTPELLDDVETVTDDVVGYLENCFE